MTGQKTILEEASLHILHLFKDKLSHDYIYHNYQHTVDTVEVCEKFSSIYNIDEEDREVLLIAAWFHDAGYVYTYYGHEEKSKEIARDFLKQKNYEGNKIAAILECINSTRKNTQPANLISKILTDTLNFGGILHARCT
jgi:HD superfamily phosphodiesterase